MTHYLVYYKGNDGKEYPEPYYAESKTIARQLFEYEFSDQILRIDNISVEEASHYIAHHLLGLLKKSNNPNEKMIGLMAKPISAIGTVLLKEYYAYIHDEYNLHASSIAKKIYNRL